MKYMSYLSAFLFSIIFVSQSHALPEKMEAWQAAAISSATGATAFVISELFAEKISSKTQSAFLHYFRIFLRNQLAHYDYRERLDWDKALYPLLISTGISLATTYAMHGTLWPKTPAGQRALAAAHKRVVEVYLIEQEQNEEYRQAELVKRAHKTLREYENDPLFDLQSDCVSVVGETDYPLVVLHSRVVLAFDELNVLLKSFSRFDVLSAEAQDVIEELKSFINEKIIPLSQKLINSKEYKAQALKAQQAQEKKEKFELEKAQVESDYLAANNIGVLAKNIEKGTNTIAKALEVVPTEVQEFKRSAASIAHNVSAAGAQTVALAAKLGEVSAMGNTISEIKKDTSEIKRETHAIKNGVEHVVQATKHVDQGVTNLSNKVDLLKVEKKKSSVAPSYNPEAFDEEGNPKEEPLYPDLHQHGRQS